MNLKMLPPPLLQEVRLWFHGLPRVIDSSFLCVEAPWSQHHWSFCLGCMHPWRQESEKDEFERTGGVIYEESWLLGALGGWELCGSYEWEAESQDRWNLNWGWLQLCQGKLGPEHEGKKAWELQQRSPCLIWQRQNKPNTFKESCESQGKSMGLKSLCGNFSKGLGIIWSYWWSI